MKPRHARAIRAGILAAREARPGDYTPILALKAPGVDAFIRTLEKEAMRRWKAARAAPEAAETFTHTRVPRTVPRATEDKTTHPQGES